MWGEINLHFNKQNILKTSGINLNSLLHTPPTFLNMALIFRHRTISI